MFEGCDRVGKTTQVALLVAAILERGIECVSKRFPDRTTATGKVIDAYLQNETQADDHVIHLLFSANRWEANAEMEQLLSAGTTVIVDRYSGSGIAYSTAKGLDFDWCIGPDKGLLTPDMVLYFYADQKVFAEGKERYEQEAFQELVSRQYDRLRFTQCWHTIKASRTIEEVHNSVISSVCHRLHNWWK